MDLPQQAENFLAVWVDVCDQRRDALLECWTNSPVFTSLILTQPDCVIQAVASRLNLRTYSPYYFLDAVLFVEDTDLVPDRPVGTTWIRRIRVAFEHEHHFDSGLFQEVSHLMITDCDLRVVVSYPRNPQDLDSQLNYLHGIIAGTDRSERIAESGSFLFIAGWRDIAARTIDWWGFVYDRTNWQRLSSQRRPA